MESTFDMIKDDVKTPDDMYFLDMKAIRSSASFGNRKKYRYFSEALEEARKVKGCRGVTKGKDGKYSIRGDPPDNPRNLLEDPAKGEKCCSWIFVGRIE